MPELRTAKINHPKLVGVSDSTNVLGFSVIAVTAMRHFMAEGSDHLVAISSNAGLRGGRCAPAYNASKAFISNYLEGLRQRVTQARLPITVTDVRPGYVDTDMAKGSGQFWVASPRAAAAQIVRAIHRRQACVYVSRRWRLIAWLLKLMPERLYRQI